MGAQNVSCFLLVIHGILMFPGAPMKTFHLTSDKC